MNITTDNLIKSKLFKTKGQHVRAYLLSENGAFFVAVVKADEPERMIIREMPNEKEARFEYNKLGIRLR